MALWQMVGGFAVFGVQDGLALPTFDWGQSVLVFVYLGLIATFAVTAIQIFAQRFTSETATVMILSLESVFAFVISIIAGFDTFTLPLLFGGMLIIAAVVFLIFDFSVLKRKPVKLIDVSLVSGDAAGETEQLND